MCLAIQSIAKLTSSPQHGILQAAIALQLLLLPHATTFIIPHELDLTQVLLLRFYGAGVACIAIISLLCRDMPNMLPCKRGAGKRSRHR